MLYQRFLIRLKEMIFPDVFKAGDAQPEDHAALIECPSPFGEWHRVPGGGVNIEVIRSERYTYVRSLQGTLAYCMITGKIPIQMNNLVGKSEYAELAEEA